MEHRGRQSAADLSVVRVTASDRPGPPEHLTPWQGDLWRSITSTKPADWFTDDTLPLLEAYVEAALTHRKASEAARKFTTEMLSDADTLKQFDKTVGIQTKAAGSMMSLAGKMRLCQSARYQPQAAHTAHNKTLKAAKPWET